MKNYFSSIVMLGLLVVMFPHGVLAAAGPGDVIKSSRSSAVYYFADDGARYVFPNEMTYFSWHQGFDDVKIVSETDLASLPLGGTVTVQAGTYLVKIPSVPTVYVVEPGGELRAIPDEATAVLLFGADWANRVIDLPESFFVHYMLGEALAENELPEATLLKDNLGELFRVNALGEAEVVDETIADDNTDFDAFALDLEELEEDLNEDIITTTDLASLLEEVEVEEEDRVHIDELDVEDVDEDEASEEIDEGESHLEEAEDLADESVADDIALAQALLEQAQAALEAGDVETAEDLAKTANKLLRDITESDRKDANDDDSEEADDDADDDSADDTSDDNSDDASDDGSGDDTETEEADDASTDDTDNETDDSSDDSSNDDSESSDGGSDSEGGSDSGSSDSSDGGSDD